MCFYSWLWLVFICSRMQVQTHWSAGYWHKWITSVKTLLLGVVYLPHHHPRLPRPSSRLLSKQHVLCWRIWLLSDAVITVKNLRVLKFVAGTFCLVNPKQGLRSIISFYIHHHLSGMMLRFMKRVKIVGEHKNVFRSLIPEATPIADMMG